MVSDIFGRMTAALFATPALTVPVTLARGDETYPARAFIRDPRDETSFGGGVVSQDTTTFEILQSAVPFRPKRGDTITWGDRAYAVQGSADQDALRTTWRIDTAPA